MRIVPRIAAALSNVEREPLALRRAGERTAVAAACRHRQDLAHAAAASAERAHRSREGLSVPTDLDEQCRRLGQGFPQTSVALAAAAVPSPGCRLVVETSRHKRTA